MGNPRTLRVRVANWSNTRFVRVEGDTVALEVLWLGCACGTCIARLAAVENRMQSADVAWQVLTEWFPGRESAPSLALIIKPAQMPVKVDEYLSGLIGLQVSEVS